MDKRSNSRGSRQLMGLLKRLRSKVGSWFSSGRLDNEALVFIKPHAANDEVKELVEAFLKEKGIDVLSEGVLTGPEIDEKGIIDSHYAHLAKIAMHKDPADLHVSEEAEQAFLDTFGETWEAAIAAEKVLNLKQFERAFPELSDAEINRLWMDEVTRVKLAPGTYVGWFSKEGRYVLNAFYGSMRAVYTDRAARVIYFTVRFSEHTLTWKDFRNLVIGATNPSEAAEGSLRSKIFHGYQALGLKHEPNVGENGIHASAGPIEGLRERIVWLGTRLEDDLFGRELLAAGVNRELLETWLDNQVVTIDGVCKHAFDLLEDLDASDVVSCALASSA